MTGASQLTLQRILSAKENQHFFTTARGHDSEMRIKHDRDTLSNKHVSRVRRCEHGLLASHIENECL